MMYPNLFNNDVTLHNGETRPARSPRRRVAPATPAAAQTEPATPAAPAAVPAAPASPVSGQVPPWLQMFGGGLGQMFGQGGQASGLPDWLHAAINRGNPNANILQGLGAGMSSFANMFRR